MISVEDNYHHLERWLSRSPVIASVHPLLPLALEKAVRIVKDGTELLRELDQYSMVLDGSILILDHDSRLLARFPQIQANEHPPIEIINRNMRFHLEYARTHLLTTRNVAQTIVDDVLKHHYEMVALVLIDGLSYGDVRDWSDTILPCFVDAPSVTYRLDKTRKIVNGEIGFASTIGSPSLFARLHDSGYTDAIGFTYWVSESNLVSDYLFERIPTRRVANFEAILRELQSIKFEQRTYLQVLREGLDGLAHSKRELSRSEIEGAITAIKNDVERLADLIKNKSRNGCIYLVADHGILWKNEHPWIVLGVPDSKPRYTENCLDETILDHCVRFERSNHAYYSFCYPYLGTKIRSDDSGVHGGLSYQESIVPFAKFEV